jgi:Tripartite tricarboxylate transporter family receptor
MSSTCAAGCVTAANCSLPSVVALTGVCECNVLISLDGGTPGKVNMASGGNGTPTHVTGELFKMLAGVNMVHVPFRGDPQVDLLGGHVDVYFSPMPASIEYIKAGNRPSRRAAVAPATGHSTKSLAR